MSEEEVRGRDSSLNKDRNSRTTLWVIVATLCLLGVLAEVGLNIFTVDLSIQANDLDAPGPYLTESKLINDLHQGKIPPGPDDWLEAHEEFGQPFGRYLTSHPNGLTDVQTKLYVQPLGEFDDKLRDLSNHTAEFLSCYYNLPTEVREPIKLNDVPNSAQRKHRGRTQFLTHYLLNDVLKPTRPDDAVAVLGLTTVDLWPGAGWNYLFGQANTPERVGIWSLYRFGDPEGKDEELQEYRKRTFKVALHETGHMLGMPHCTYYECLMNGSNHLAEMDSRPFWLCPECVRKVWWNCKSDPTSRYKQLIEFGETHGLRKEIAFWKRSMSLIERHR